MLEHGAPSAPHGFVLIGPTSLHFPLPLRLVCPTRAGLEPATPGSGGRCLIHWNTGRTRGSAFPGEGLCLPREPSILGACGKLGGRPFGSCLRAENYESGSVWFVCFWRGVGVVVFVATWMCKGKPKQCVNLQHLKPEAKLGLLTIEY